MTIIRTRCSIFALMYSTFPTVINPWTVAHNAELIEGKFDLSLFERVISLQNKQHGDVLAKVQISKVSKDKLSVTGQLNYDLALVCQRCLEAMPEHYDFPFELIIVKYEALLESLPKGEDGIVCEESLDLIQLLEEEVLLKLPMIARHDNCVGLTTEEKLEKGGQTPFASLKDLMN